MSDIKDWLDQNRGGGDSPAFKFDHPGARVAGTVVRASTPEVDDLNGGRVRKLVVELHTDDDTTWAVWVNPGRMTKAVYDAVQEAGATTIAEGGRLAIAYTGDGEQTRAGFNRPKLYKAKYEPPAGGVKVDDPFGEDPF